MSDKVKGMWYKRTYLEESRKIPNISHRITSARPLFCRLASLYERPAPLGFVRITLRDTIFVNKLVLIYLKSLILQFALLFVTAVSTNNFRYRFVKSARHCLNFAQSPCF
jgi:hypothetical protein